MSKTGSLVYQMQETLKRVFRPGRRRHHDKQHGRDDWIRGVQTMRCMVSDASQFAHYIRERWPEVRRLEMVTPAMAQAYIAEHIRRENSGGYIGRVIASLRKLDAACRHTGIWEAERPALLPYAGETGVSGFHADPRPMPYTDEQAQALIEHIAQDDPTAARVCQAMWVIGLRVSEAVYLHAQDIHLPAGAVSLAGSPNHTKGGRPRDVKVQNNDPEFLSELQAIGAQCPDGHIFTNRKRLAERVRGRVREACRVLGIPQLGTHGFRKTFAVDDYQRNRAAGQGDAEALRSTSRQLGHNRARVTGESYVPPQVRQVD